jgi:hypothetical protein
MVNVGNLHDAQAMERVREGVQPDALIVHSESIAGAPSHGRFQSCPRRVVLNTAAAPSAKPSRHFVAGSEVPRNRKCKAIPHHPSVDATNFREPNTGWNMRQCNVLQTRVQNGNGEFEAEKITGE